MADKEIVEEAGDEYDTIIFDGGNIYVEREGEKEEKCKDYPDEKRVERMEYMKWIYEDIQEMGRQSTILDGMRFGRFCDYIEHSEMLMGGGDIYNWSECDPNEHQIRQYGRRKPTFKQWVRHYIKELMELFDYMMRTYELEIGSFECFMTECYTQSSSAGMIPIR
jgi:hypothetical protein